MNFAGGFDGGASQFAGGGFMATQGGGDGAGGATQAPKGGRQNQTLRAVTVKQLVAGLNDSQDDDFRIDGAELHNVALVGKIVSLTDRSQMISAMVNDGTGTVEVRNWINDDSDPAQHQSEWQVGKYVRVYGHIRTFNKEKSVVAYNMRPIQDFNEVTYHFTQCIFQHLHLTKGAPPAAGQGAAAGHTPAPAWGGAGATAGYGGAYGAAAPPADGMGGGAFGSNGMGVPAGAPKKLEEKILEIYNAPEHLAKSSGLHINEVMNLLGGSAGYTEVKTAVDFLAQEGHLYTTVDETTFRSTSA